MIEYLEKLVEDKEYLKALAYAEELLLNREKSLGELLAIHCAMLTCRVMLGDYSGALVSGQSATKLAHDLEAWDSYGMACGNLAVAYDRLGELEAALSWWFEYLAKLPFYRTVFVYEPIAWYNLGNAYVGIGNGSEASQAFSKALQVANRMENGRDAHGIRHGLIKAYIKTGELLSIPSLLAKCAHYLRNHPEENDSRLFHLKLRAEFAILTNRLDRAKAVSLRGLFESENMPRVQFDFHMLLGKIAYKAGSAKESLGHSLSARVYAIRCRRYDLESEATEFTYSIMKAHPGVYQELDDYYLYESITHSSDEEVLAND